MSNINELAVNICGIQHFSLFNGPGIRTTVFFKGCPLRCAWCCNPETQSQNIKVLYDRCACIGQKNCGKCFTVCKAKAIYRLSDDTIGLARDLCVNCGACTMVCPSRAFKLDGEIVQIQAIMESIFVDIEYIRENGGITLSGGEPFMRPKAAAALLCACKEHALHTAVESCGYFDLDDTDVVRALKHTDILYYDIKHVDSQKHKDETSVDNTRILNNLKKLVEDFSDLKIVIRTLIVPGFNDSLEEFSAIANFVKSMKNISSFEVMPLNTMCSEKYMQLGLPLPYAFSNKLEKGFGEKCLNIGKNLSLPIEVIS